MFLEVAHALVSRALFDCQPAVCPRPEFPNHLIQRGALSWTMVNELTACNNTRVHIYVKKTTKKKKKLKKNSGFDVMTRCTLRLETV